MDSVSTDDYIKLNKLFIDKETSQKSLKNVPKWEGYVQQKKKCVNGANIAPGVIPGKTVAECSALCDANRNCKAFEYGTDYGGQGRYKTGDCQLQSSADSTGCNGAYHNLDLYVPNKKNGFSNKCEYDKKKLVFKLNYLQKQIKKYKDDYKVLDNKFNLLKLDNSYVINDNISDDNQKISKLHKYQTYILNNKENEIINKKNIINKNEEIKSDKIDLITTNKRQNEYNYNEYLQKKIIYKIFFILTFLTGILTTVFIIYKYQLYNYFILKN